MVWFMVSESWDVWGSPVDPELVEGHALHQVGELVLAVLSERLLGYPSQSPRPNPHRQLQIRLPVPDAVLTISPPVWPSIPTRAVVLPSRRFEQAGDRVLRVDL